MKGGARPGSGRPSKPEEDKAVYIAKTIKFKEEEQYILDYIENSKGKNFSDKLKNIIIKTIEKK